MKNKIAFGIVLLSLLISVSVSNIGCMTSSGGSGGGLCVIGAYSWPWFYVLKNANITFSNYARPATGEAITDAVITVSNTTTGTSTSCAYVGSGIYSAVNMLNHNAGESVGFSMTSSAGNITGASTVTPNSSVSITAPLTTTVTRPFTVSWNFTPGTYPAGYVWINIRNISWTDGYQIMVPAGTTSCTISTSDLQGGGNTYYLWAIPVNQMSLSGAMSGSVVGVGSSGSSDYKTLTVN